MVVVYTILNIAWLGVWQHSAARLSDLRLRHVLADILPYMLTAAASMLAVYFITKPISPLFVLLIVRIIAGALLYLLLAKLFRLPLIDQCIDFVKKKFIR